MTIPRNQADPNPSGGYRDRILHYDETSPPEGDLYVLSGFYDDGSPRYVQGMQAPSAQAVTGGRRNELVIDDSEPEVLCGERRPRTAGRCEVPARLHKHGASPFYDQHIGRDTAGRWHIWEVEADQAVTSGHGECECGDCSGWTYAWAAWAATR